MNPRTGPNAAAGAAGIVGIALAIAVAGAAFAYSQKDMLANLKSQNLIASIWQLNDTTDQMLQHTTELSQNVQTVKGQLNQLTVQNQILDQQTETGTKLQDALTQQESLTRQGVNLMAEILKREKVSVASTDQVASQTQSLSENTNQNRIVMQSMIQSLSVSLKKSQELNQSLDPLLAQLNQSRDTFHFFGRLKDLLSKNPLDLNNPLEKLLPFGSSGSPLNSLVPPVNIPGGASTKPGGSSPLPGLPINPPIPKLPILNLP